jgi:membrane protein implicated in regulation of membrane protease activity
MNWILMSTLSRVLVVATGIALTAVIVLLVLGVSNPYLIFAALALVIASIVLHRRDMNRAIARQLQRDADDAASDRAPQE